MLWFLSLTWFSNKKNTHTNSLFPPPPPSLSLSLSPSPSLSLLACHTRNWPLDIAFWEVEMNGGDVDAEIVGGLHSQLFDDGLSLRHVAGPPNLLTQPPPPACSNPSTCQHLPPYLASQQPLHLSAPPTLFSFIATPPPGHTSCPS